MTVGPLFFSPHEGVINSYTASLWGAYGLVVLVSGYTGSAIRVRRSSDNVEQDIGFTFLSVLDTSALASFVGANNGFIVKWYDQSGGGNDFSQITTGKQPQIVISGTYTGELLFDGIDDEVLTANSTGTPTGFTLLYAGRCRIGSQGGTSPSDEVILGHTGGTLFWTSRNTTYSNLLQTYCSHGTGTLRYPNAGSTDGAVYVARFDRTQVTLQTELSFFVDGVPLTSAGFGGDSAVVTGNFPTGPWAAGGDVHGSFARCALRSVLIYEAAKTNADILAFSAALTPTINFNCFDAYTSGLWGLYALRQELSSYAGASIRVRRSSDNTEQDIGFSAGRLDTVALLAFAGAGSAFVTTFYDQSGNGRNFTQATTTQQPRIVNAGGLDAAGMRFDASDDVLVTTGFNATATDKFTMFFKGNATSVPGFMNLLELGAAFNTNRGVLLGMNTSGQTQVGTGTNATDYTYISSNVSASNQILCAKIDRSQALRVNQTALFSGGRQLSEVDQSGTGTIPSGNVTAAPWYLGGRSTAGSFCFAGTIHTVALYEGLVSDANVETISRLLG